MKMSHEYMMDESNYEMDYTSLAPKIGKKMIVPLLLHQKTAIEHEDLPSL